MRVAVYARVSSSRQKQEKTIASQLEALKTYAAIHGHQIVSGGEFLDDGFSGARLDRPALDRLRDGARAGDFEAVLVLSPDRLSHKYAFYTTAARFAAQRLPGLLPGQPGPKRPHKVTAEMEAFFHARFREDPNVRPGDLPGEAAGRLGVGVHPRTVRRRLEKKKARGRPVVHVVVGSKEFFQPNDPVQAAYEAGRRRCSWPGNPYWHHSWRCGSAVRSVLPAGA